MAGLDSLYQELILDHSKRRVGAADLAGTVEPPHSATSHQRNPVCGDEITLRATLAGGSDDDDGEVVSDVAWEGLGCSISQASASMLTELARGASTAEVARLTEGFREAMRSKGKLALDEEVFGDAAALSGVSRFTARVKCAMLAWVALEDAVRRAHPSAG
ncbi:SUF system NifU family Fe-S cluster assembly protein [Streptomyces sp. NP160]|uniref:Fe-S cluster assembly sulfur transfer protein SufU n=1 Tax=Streptomyces sp. NP160 TaxID=2586637 RepID=UPI001119FB03|nr:SUF system NifU family Fe-S cluster assembly protein [Streptomyces sp. NP160]TNM69689.1 SUF system NifU family Fe-S cluster assembly protein [Streptomyces sp. NP160]